ncbi:MAG: hypothetical protein Q7R97_03230 [Candidatus Daviesbacteria bacterium]|nr:hypothetical protein [Candidatus Daviesbacteria bacterium]
MFIISMNIKIKKLPSEERVEIKIDNDSKYARVAFLVDREDFFKDIKDIRKNLGITELIPYEKVKEWLNEDRTEGSLLTMDKKGKDSFNKLWKFSNAVSKLKNKYHKGFHFTEIITHTILSGEVREEDYDSSVFCVDYPFTEEFIEAELHIDDEPMAAIFVNKDTQEDEVVELLKTKVKKLFEQVSEREKKPPRTSSNIKRDRKWYWKHKDDLSYQEILDQTPKNEAVVGRQAIIDAIIQYEFNIGVRK